MKKFLNLPIFLFAFFTFFSISHVMAAPSLAAKFILTPSSGTITGPTNIALTIDSEGKTIDSAAAVIVFDVSKVKITQATKANTNAFAVLSQDVGTAGEITLTGTSSLGDLTGLTGIINFATITIEPLVTSGTFALSYRCSSTQSDDSNIVELNGSNLISTDAQCALNVPGSYTAGVATSNPAPTTAPTNTTSTTTTNTTTTGSQPAAPETLPEAGFKDWLKWLTSGLALLGIGLLLL